MRHDLILRGVDGDIPMITLTVISDNGILFHLLRIGEHLRLVAHELQFVNGIITLLQLHEVAILIGKPEHIR